MKTCQNDEEKRSWQTEYWSVWHAVSVRTYRPAGDVTQIWRLKRGRLSCNQKSNNNSYFGGKCSPIFAFSSVVSCPDISGCSVFARLSGDIHQEGRAYCISKIHRNTSLESICYWTTGPKHSQTHTFWSLTLERLAWVSFLVCSVELFCGSLVQLWLHLLLKLFTRTLREAAAINSLECVQGREGQRLIWQEKSVSSIQDGCRKKKDTFHLHIW